jgi:hypothetical protein
MDELKRVTLDTVAGGVAGERFQVEHERVIENMLDPNTALKTKRKVVIEFVYTPSDDRASAKVEVRSRHQLAADKPSEGTIYMGRRKGKAVSLTRDYRQEELPFDEPEPEADEPEAGAEGVVSIEQRRSQG